MLLLVEDNPDDVELTLLAMRQDGPTDTTVVVRDGAEALDFVFHRGCFSDRVPAETPDAVLLDIKLPLVDGIEVLRSIRADARTRHLPVVMLTSSAQASDLTACYDLGVNSYIVKPVDVDAFFTTVRQIGRYWTVLNHPEAV